MAASRLAMLDALRFVAALVVVAFHFTAVTSPAWGGRVPAEMAGVGTWTAYGRLGVLLFFVISGFVLLMTAWGRSVPQFVASRVGRLFPAYWVAVAFSAVLVFWLWPENLAFTGTVISETQAMLNFSMMQSAFGAPNLDSPYWTLWYELKFYLLIAIFMMIGITRQRVLAFAALWPVVSAIASGAGQGFITSFLMPDYAPFFAGGMLLYLIYRDGHDLGTWLLVGFQVAIAANLSWGFYSDLATNTPAIPSRPIVVLLVIGCFAAVAAVTLTPLARVSAGWLTTLGALTYPLYVVHQNWGWYLIHLLRDAMGAWGAVAVAFAVVLTASYLIYRFVERPFGTRLRAATLTMLHRTARPGDDGIGSGGDRPDPAPRDRTPLRQIAPLPVTMSDRAPGSAVDAHEDDGTPLGAGPRGFGFVLRPRGARPPAESHVEPAAKV
jgi:peptidoglycan/LPS O-acetylase OafA/YrhL